MNVYESGQRKVIPAVLVYVRDSAGRVLMIHRDARERPGDYHAGRWNGLGGKFEADESPLEAARRELREESGLELPESVFMPLGTLQFPNFKSHKAEDWVVFVFIAELGAASASVPRARSEEGSLHWVPAGEVLGLNLWPGDREFVPHVLAGEPFVGTIWYRGAEVVRHWVRRLR